MRWFPLALLAISLAAGEASPVLPKPSANAGKTGMYQVQTGVAGYSYYVFVPEAKAGTHFGLHLFFHGQNCQTLAHDFRQYQPMLAYGLIGINMCYADGDNLKDTAGKVAVAKAAALQVMADYPVVPGRGMVACFSGGGGPTGMWYSEAGKNRGLAWPFTSLALYSANFRDGVMPGVPTGWFIGVNTDEWSIAALGETQTARFGEALAAMASAGPDQRLLILPQVGHETRPKSFEEATGIFRRTDLAYAPFIHRPSLPARALGSIIATANAGQLGQAATALAKLKPDPAIATQVQDLSQRIDERAAAQIAMIGELAGSDPLLAAWYGGLFTKGLKGHPRAKELEDKLAPVLKNRKAVNSAEAANAAFAKLFPSIFSGGPVIAAAAVPQLEQIRKAAGEQSHLGLMVGELLALPHAPGKR